MKMQSKDKTWVEGILILKHVFAFILVLIYAYFKKLNWN